MNIKEWNLSYTEMDMMAHILESDLKDTKERLKMVENGQLDGNIYILNWNIQKKTELLEKLHKEMEN